jgi:hypothetical protein
MHVPITVNLAEATHYRHPAGHLEWYVLPRGGVIVYVPSSGTYALSGFSPDTVRDLGGRVAGTDGVTA